MTKHSGLKRQRRGAIIALAAIALIPILAMVALAVDYGYLVKVRTDLQRAADLAALAGVPALLPDASGNQDLAAVRSAVRNCVHSNIDTSFVVRDADIQIGRYDPATVYTNVSLLNTGVFDTVRVTLRYDEAANSSVSLFFARAFGAETADVGATSTAALQKARFMFPGAEILPFAVPLEVWDARNPGEEWSVYSNGRIEDSNGDRIPGNWGTVDIGVDGNSTSDLSNQIYEGLRQSDLDEMYAEDRISSSTNLDAGETIWANADTGLSSGMKSAVQSVHGEQRIVPIYDMSHGGGNNLEFRVIGWGVVTVLRSNWGGNNNTRVTVKKSFRYDAEISPQPSLSQTTGFIEGMYSSPVLLE